MIALTRIVTRNTNIPATTALTTLDPQNRVKSLMAGANIIMPDFTPIKYRRLYEIYPGKGSGTAAPAEIIDGIKRDVEKTGRIIGPGPATAEKIDRDFSAYINCNLIFQMDNLLQDKIRSRQLLISSFCCRELFIHLRFSGRTF
ncbi:hypothetical protein [Bacteroides graminisolvens]|uniref:hypothetical protein n=1 Tax=Bacteroides graminisolvens TaxID=477666 RepID=UPI0029C9AC0E|nr:hypothetical protein [Bacteroides graminisolvens]